MATVVGVKGSRERVNIMRSGRRKAGRGVKSRQGAGAEIVFGAMVRAMA